MNFAIIVATDLGNGIGKGNTLPWNFPEDLKNFKQITTQAPEGKINAVIMGRKTWESIPEKFRPLPNRINVVLSSQELQLPENVFLSKSLNKSLDLLSKKENINKIFIIGGAQLYNEAINHPNFNELYLTKINKTYDCDTFFPKINLSQFNLITESNSHQLTFLHYKK